MANIVFVCMNDIITLCSQSYLIRDVIDLAIGSLCFAHEIVFDQEDIIMRDNFLKSVR